MACFAKDLAVGGGGGEVGRRGQNRMLIKREKGNVWNTENENKKERTKRTTRIECGKGKCTDKKENKTSLIYKERDRVQSHI
jgi:hypothetical protein